MKSAHVKKKPLIILAVILLLALAALVFLKGYKSAKQRYEEEIAKLQDEVDRLSDPVAVYEVAAQEIDISVIRAQVQDIGELATVEYFYTDAKSIIFKLLENDSIKEAGYGIEIEVVEE